MISTLLENYQAILSDIDRKSLEATQAVKEIPCKKGCFDCCKQIFPLSLIEAYWLNDGFKNLPLKLRRELERSAHKYQQKLATFDITQFEISSDDLQEIAKKRNELVTTMRKIPMDCPILSPEGICHLYPQRNHDCRIHGVSYDPYTEEIVGCFRHPVIFQSPLLKEKFLRHAVPSGHLYKKKSKLDSLMTIHLSGSEKFKYCYYYTLPHLIFLKNFQTFDWKNFFEKKVAAFPAAKYQLIIDK